MATWLITGCSTGLGRALAQEVLAAGHNAVITARDTATLTELAEAYPQTYLAVPLDVRFGDQVIAAVDTAHQHFGDIDVLVNNAGYGYRAAVEEGEEDEIKQMFETNYYGAVRMINAVLPGMRYRRSGTIINISSIAGQRSAPGSGFYAASKAALESTSEALQQEGEPLGIRVAIVQPGPFRTDFAGRSLRQSADPIEAYAETAGRRRKEHDTSDGTQPGDPVRAAKAIITLAETPQPPMRLVLGSTAAKLAEVDLNQQLDDLMDWEPVSLSTEFSTEAD
ncbi:oxidoreductase [Enteractinococcus helveticum]|uniref:Short-chain dehydrogenase/reductase n=1 Tax=Enteractinococcus helveticum TaxID=1837282 RepID=A0A1B7M2H6_9MICC|nr:oxidoreductase [Enteractinococcus helveticum]OAV62771.1 short-chain dehydrogenase/reductase [Enteractinococcus helveticum]